MSNSSGQSRRNGRFAGRAAQALSGRHWRWLIPAGSVALLSAMLFLLLSADEWTGFFVDRGTQPWLFVALMLLLPIIGFPIVPFLVLVGVKFGPLWGIAATGLAFSVHVVASFVLAHSVVRPLLSRLLSRTRYELPRIQGQRLVPFSLTFMAVPGLPYAVKNYMLALLDVPFRIYLPVTWGVNLAFAIPLVGLGHSLIAKPGLAWIFVAILVGAYLLARRLGVDRDSTADGNADGEP